MQMTNMDITGRSKNVVTKMGIVDGNTWRWLVYLVVLEVMEGEVNNE